MSQLDRLVMIALAAAESGIGKMSTGEALTAALILNRSDWLKAMNYTIADAIDRVGAEWAGFIPEASRAIAANVVAMKQAEISSQEEFALKYLSGNAEALDVNAKLVTYGTAPGYRDISFIFDVSRLCADTPHRIHMRISQKDNEFMYNYILEVHQNAWKFGDPIDLMPSETRPKWI
jgi:hypothetical protein